MTRLFFNYQVNEKMPEYIEPLVGYLDASIPDEWEIYVQPWLNGLCPDVLLLNPSRGIHIIECKQSVNISIDRLKDILKNIKELYCPKMFRNKENNKLSGENIFTSYADLTTNYDAIDAELDSYKHNRREVLPSPYSTISKENLDLGFETSIKLMDDDYNFNFDPSYADELRSFLRPSDFKLDNIAPLPSLDKKQIDLVEKTTPKFQRFTGSAGSGKTFVLAAKAAHLLANNKKILFLTYNKTLINYISVLIQRNLFAKGQEHLEKTNLLTIQNFHKFSKRFLIDKGWSKLYYALWWPGQSKKDSDLALNEKLPNLLLKCINQEGTQTKDTFDALFIDEGQDFHPAWWDSTKPLLREDGQACFVYDFTQDLYKKKSLWPGEKFTGSGFVGRPSKLDISYRLPNQYLPKIRYFLDCFQSEIDTANFEINLPEINPQANLLEELNTTWLQVDEDLNHQSCISSITEYASLDTDYFSYGSILFLAETNNSGLDICNSLKELNISVTHTFGPGQLDSKQKFFFSLLNDPIKATTIHSGKGLESSLLIIQIKSGAKIAHVYTALTRLRMGANNQCSIIVVCSDPKYADYGKSW
jgi:hypothetical protein